MENTIHGRSLLKIERLEKLIQDIENCLVCHPIADPDELIDSVQKMIKEHRDEES